VDTCLSAVIACDKREAFAQGSKATTCPPKLEERRRKQSISPHAWRDGLLRFARNDGSTANGSRLDSHLLAAACRFFPSSYHMSKTRGARRVYAPKSRQAKYFAIDCNLGGRCIIRAAAFRWADAHDKSRCPLRGLADLAGRTQRRTDLPAACVNVAEEVARPDGAPAPARRPA
jgi:hypothetical protein